MANEGEGGETDRGMVDFNQQAGAGYQSRTDDLLITNQLLYH